MSDYPQANVAGFEWSYCAVCDRRMQVESNPPRLMLHMVKKPGEPDSAFRKCPGSGGDPFFVALAVLGPDDEERQ